MRAIRRFTVRPVLPPELTALGDLATNLRWSWHLDTQDLFASVDAEVWEAVGHDPQKLLGGVSARRLTTLARDRRFLGRLAHLRGDLEDYLTGDRWYQTLGPDVPRCIAYFSPEFGVSSVMPQYSGGLGILAGDHLKAASDLGVPLVGVGLLYRRGYFRQSLSADGWQQERYPVVDPYAMPIRLLREADDSPLRIRLALPRDRLLTAQVWVAQVGRVPLLLLDSELEENEPATRQITDRLYGGGLEHRLQQEMLLGIGGVRAIRAWSRLTGSPAPAVYHTNEGHAGFLGLERLREYVSENGLDFDSALEVTRAGTVFTTHTPVPAGIDRFPRKLIEEHFAVHDCPSCLAGGGAVCATCKWPIDRVLELGAEDYPGGDPTVFNMAVMGLRLAQRANGVSLLHGKVSREMFAGLWPGFDVAEVPITSITNGVHAPTWVAPEVWRLAERIGIIGDGDAVGGGLDWAAVDKIPDAELWELLRTLRLRLVLEARRRLRESGAARGTSEAELSWIDTALDPDVLTIGFARRVPSYKRLTLMMRDPAKLRELLLHPTRPIQIVVAGKAHPADQDGKKLIQTLVRLTDQPDIRHRIVFLPDYDMALAGPLVAGCDVWLNNPLRPYEASGTSGMKAALNGALNVSIRDGWWDEWFDGENGWAIPSAEGVTDPNRRDDLEAAALYEVLAGHVAPRFYDRGPDDVPAAWLASVRHTLRSLGPKVLASRMVGEYVERLYIPAAASLRALNHTFDGAQRLAAWKERVRAGWADVEVEHLESTQVGASAELGTVIRLVATVRLGELSPADVAVQVVYGRVDESDVLTDQETQTLEFADRDDNGRCRFEGDLKLARTGPFGYTVRVLPYHAQLASPAETALVAWPAEQRAAEPAEPATAP